MISHPLLRSALCFPACWILSCQPSGAATKPLPPVLASQVLNSQTSQAQQNGVVLVVHAPKHGAVGKPFIVEVDVANHSKELIYYRVQPLYPDLHIQVQDDHGIAVPQTRFGQKAFPISHGVEGAFVTGPLPIGKSFHVTLDLTRLYDLSLADHYKLSVAININPAGFQGYSVEAPTLNFGLIDLNNLSQRKLWSASQ